MPNRHPVGRSSFSDGSSTSPRGKMQYVSTLIVARQVASLCYEFDTQYPGALARGDRLTINEAIREDDRAIQLYEDYRRDPAHHPLAAFAQRWPRIITTTHRSDIGTALDIGITRADGSNRAMTASEAAWVDRMGPRRGIRPTGNLFVRREPWHKNGGYGYTVPPIVGVNLPGEKFYTDIQKPEPTPAPQPRNEYDMDVQWNDKHTEALIIAGSDHITLKDGSEKIAGVDWKGQVKLCERITRTDPKDAYAGGLNNAEHQVVRLLLNKAREARNADIAAAVAKIIGKA